MVFGLKKKKSKEDEIVEKIQKSGGLRAQFVADLSDFLVSYGFDRAESLKVADDFYEKHKSKIKDVLFYNLLSLPQ